MISLCVASSRRHSYSWRANRVFASVPAIPAHNRTISSWLEAQAQGQLADACIYCGAADHSECGRSKVRVRIGKLRMVERVVQFRAKLDAAFFARPIESQHSRKRHIQVGLAGTVYNACPTVS